ncbi:peroxidase-related enzyme [Bradyrhizobium sp. Arg237L]|uniref:carboxymuconolactone decarboxylase family protein n=1 Tax=Bradyrhizobium sp. Arg237L TaxID=3003352 RepID=UPI00249ECE4D|nr:peroxidase-related enzyme [Bradyrhizobium sp. Arg237L]MDI4238471.1 peroxidase-related enzyme [Bradyrhizobium sp. Arg237L]
MSSRIKIPTREEAPDASQPALEKVNKTLGFVPNLQRLMSISPAALNGWAGLMGSLSTTLDLKTRDGIALAVSEADGCNYCLAAHSYTARNLAKIDVDEISINREGRSADPKRQAAILFAKRLIETAGKVSDEEFEAVRKAGWSDANIIEMIALTAQFLLTNFINNAVQTPIDFPSVPPAKPKVA